MTDTNTDTSSSNQANSSQSIDTDTSITETNNQSVTSSLFDTFTSYTQQHTVPSTQSLWCAFSTLQSKITENTQHLSQTLIQHSEKLLETAQHDLHEFTESLSSENTNILHNAKNVFNSQLQHLSTTAKHLFDNDTENDSQIETNKDALKSAKTALQKLQANTDTYTVEPTDTAFATFKQQFTTGFTTIYEPQINEINDIYILNAYEKLVPDTVSDFDFFCRYYYSKQQYEQQQLQRSQVINKLMSNSATVEELPWDDDTVADNTADNTEIDQTDSVTATIRPSMSSLRIDAQNEVNQSRSTTPTNVQQSTELHTDKAEPITVERQKSNETVDADIQPSEQTVDDTVSAVSSPIDATEPQSINPEEKSMLSDDSSVYEWS